MISSCCLSLEASEGQGLGFRGDFREDLESRSPNLGTYTTKGTLWEPPIKGSTFWILSGVWVEESEGHAVWDLGYSDVQCAVSRLAWDSSS